MLHGGVDRIPEGTVWGTCTGAGTSLKTMAHGGLHTGAEETKKEGVVD